MASPWPFRVSVPLLEIVELLLAHQQPVHGWVLMRACGRVPGTVYGVLERLRDAGWADAYWEVQESGVSRPRRRYYRLTDIGLAEGPRLLAARAGRRRVRGSASR